MLRRISNIPPRLLELSERKLIREPDHPLGILKHLIHNFVSASYPGVFTLKDNFDPKVTVKQNFDDLLIPKDHVSRSPSDTYYFDDNYLLRTHTTAHEIEMMSNYKAYLLAGDVYRRDEIDSTHYPIFHQMEGVRLWTFKELGVTSKKAGVDYVLRDLKNILEQLSRHLLGDNIEMRWVDAYFPFTDPSLELEVYYQQKWLEMLGCGVLHPGVLSNAGFSDDTIGWAFGLGLERWAMKLFDIPDIRLFWSKDPRFTSQFSQAKGISKFKAFSKHPVCYKDISFWRPESFEPNDFFEQVREAGQDLIEKVELIDDFEKGGRRSLCYRISYRSMERNLTNEEIDSIQFKLREKLLSRGVELR
mmetsp:Transcript_17428/g.31452  ORF Transcript_17428/g.31452 Transcript_17428/m.31452 type:complete len:360 (-) Transcript_17428:3241-4320(-)